MSGGVDSSVAAALLVKAGFDVIGMTMKIIADSGSADASPQSNAAIENAASVAESLGIPHHAFDLRDVFEQCVVDRFLAAYTSGRTPNPCVICNPRIKWAMLAQRASELGYDLFATGHYVRIARFSNGIHTLYRGIDKNKEQSYFLWGLESRVLPETVFPLGGYTKNETRLKANALKLKTAEHPESQEICFIPDNDYRAFLRRRFQDELPLAMTPGDIVDMNGKTLGRHDGCAFYTIGQRRGLGIALGLPMYVAEIDAAENRVIIGTGDDLVDKGMIVGSINWLRDVPSESSFRCSTKIRYRHKGAASSVIYRENEAEVWFEKPQRAITPGQSAVFYNENFVIGGGIIEKILK